MNRQIVQLFGLSLVLFATLVGFTSYWSVFDAEALKDEPANRRPLIEEQRIPRGLILASDGTVLARSVGARLGRAPGRSPAPIRPARCSPTPWATRSSRRAGRGWSSRATAT